MGRVNAKQVISNLYGLMMEINLHRTDEDVLAELQSSNDPQIDKHLLRIKQITAKVKADATMVRFQKALEQIQLLKQKGLDELKKLIKPEERAELIPLFRKFEELSKDDEAAIIEDQELLQLMEILKDRLNDEAE